MASSAHRPSRPRAPAETGVGTARRPVGDRPEVAALLRLQRQAGNSAVASALVGAVPTVQRGLIPDGQPRAGRVPPAEKASLGLLLAGNGFDAIAVRKAMSLPVNAAALRKQFAVVMNVDDDFLNYQGKENWQVRARGKLRVRLEVEYHRLLSLAEVFRDEADDAYDQIVVTEAAALVATPPKATQFFKSKDPWKSFVGSLKERMPDQLGKFTNEHNFAEAVFKRANLMVKPVKPAPPGLTPAQQVELDDEKAAVNVQLALWANVSANAPGCNPQGTWGTSKGGAGNGFAATTVSQAVWRKLRAWWIRKDGAYITPSDTTTHSLKMWRDVDNANLSPTLNYHINVA